MKRVVSLSSIALLVAACGGPSTEIAEQTSAATDVQRLEQSYAGLTASDERPQFDDDRVREEDRRDRDVPMDERPDVDATRGVVVLTIRYGNLDEDRTRRDVERWRFRVNAAGGVFLRGRVFAEDREETGLARESRSVVTWHSATPSGDHDGARFAIGYTSDSRGLGIETNGLSIGIPLAELVDFERLYRTEGGHVYVRAHRAVRDGGDQDDAQCRGGTIRARATGLNGDGVGQVHGVVRNRAGDTLGHIRGRYGVRNNGERVFFAKIIGRGGEFVGRVRGTFERIDRESIEVRARLHARGSDATGVVRGRIVHREDQRGGVFLARWALNCDDSMPRDRLPPENDRSERERGARD